jgi:transglutaminase-like putative cysteine protease
MLLLTSAFLSISEPFRSAAHTRYTDLSSSVLDLKDSDGDALMDDQELSMGLDPLNPDTDGDGIDDGAEYIYWSSRSVGDDVDVTSWHRSLHGDIGESQVRELLRPLSDMDADTAANILDRDSDDDGLADGKERELGLDPANPDTDGDGLLDFYDPTNSAADLDRDGIPDDWEDFYGVQDDGPDTDSDGDGRSNYQEYLAGTNPRDDRGTSPVYIRGGEGDIAVRPGTDPVLEVDWSEPVFYARTGVNVPYWKISTFDDYRRTGWVSALGGRTMGPEPLFAGLPYTPVTTQLTFAGVWIGYLPSVEHVVKVGAVTPPAAPVVPYRSGELEAKVPIVAISYDSIVYNLTDATEGQWDDRTTAEAARYLAVPKGMDPRLAGLAGKLLDATGNSTMQRALIAAGAVYRSCRLVWAQNAVPPDGVDPPTWVLFDSPLGNGTHYDIASAYVLLARSMGVPARLVAGYRGGIIGDEAITVLKRHEWTWAEVLVPGMGWIRVDPTLPNPLPDDSFGGYAPRPGAVPPGTVRPGPPGEIPPGWANRTPDDGPWTGPGTNLTGHQVNGTPVDPKGDLDGDGTPNEADMDADGDGLERPQEEMLGTSDYNRDSDWDGLDDWTEVWSIGSNPMNRDTDQDGLSDGLEWAVMGTNATRADTDGGGANDGAEVVAKTDPLDPRDDSKARDSDGDGLTDSQELILRTNATLADTDGDGLTDSQELNLGTDPLMKDTDGDGLSDGMEAEMGTNPLDPLSNATTGPGNITPPINTSVPDPSDPSSGTEPTDPAGNRTVDPIDPWQPPETEGAGSVWPTGGGGLGEGARALVALLAAVAMMGLYLLWRRIHVKELEEVLELAEEELYKLDLDDLDAVRKVIVRAYLGFCEVLRRYEFLRDEAWTVREFEAAAREALPFVPEREVEELTWLFEEARYSAHDLPQDLGYRAALCLGSIRTAILPGRELGQLEPVSTGAVAAARAGGVR